MAQAIKCRLARLRVQAKTQTNKRVEVDGKGEAAKSLLVSFTTQRSSFGSKPVIFFKLALVMFELSLTTKLGNILS